MEDAKSVTATVTALLTDALQQRCNWWHRADLKTILCSCLPDTRWSPSSSDKYAPRSSCPIVQALSGRAGCSALEEIGSQDSQPTSFAIVAAIRRARVSDVFASWIARTCSFRRDGAKPSKVSRAPESARASARSVGT